MRAFNHPHEYPINYIPISENEIVLTGSVAEVVSEVHTWLEGRVTHDGGPLALGTQRHSEAHSIRHKYGQLVRKPSTSQQ